MLNVHKHHDTVDGLVDHLSDVFAVFKAQPFQVFDGNHIGLFIRNPVDVCYGKLLVV